MKYKVLAMDFDGTLLTSKKSITQKTKNTILKYKNEGYIIIGITARNLPSVEGVCNIDIFNFLILNNGSYIYNVDKKEGNYINTIDRKTAEKLTNYFKNIANEIDYCSAEKYYIYKSEITNNRKFLIKINNLEEVNELISRMNIFLDNNEEVIKYKKYIDENFDDISSIIMQDTDNSSGATWLALMPKHTNKLVTLEKLCKNLNIDIDEVIFFGDGANDVEIIEKVGLGIAMGNALPEVKEVAKEITLSNDEDGIVVFLENLQLT